MLERLLGAVGLARSDVEVAATFARAALFDPYQPLLVFLTPTRRCNLSCGYCFEYDDHSPPVPFEVLRQRIAHLARLRVAIVTLSGGEPLLHPELGPLVAEIRERGMTPCINTNGFLLTPALIEDLNAAGLHSLQISVDAVRPNAMTQKALALLMPKLRALGRHARFRVRVNTVLGAAPAEEALAVARAALEHGFDAKVALLRDEPGNPAPLDADTRRAYRRIQRLSGRWRGTFGESFQHALLDRGRVDWKCRAGARFFTVCEHGLVHLCTPRFGTPSKPLAEYGLEDVRRAFAEEKPCAPNCAVPYAHQVSRIDRFRRQAAREPRRRLTVLA